MNRIMSNYSETEILDAILEIIKNNLGIRTFQLIEELCWHNNTWYNQSYHQV